MSLCRYPRVLRRSCLGVGVRYGVAGARKLYSDNAPSRGPPYTTDLCEATASLSSSRPLPVYRVMDSTGTVLDSSQDPNIPESTLLKMYEKMVTVCELDQNLYTAQRMGIISFYIMAYGEEGTSIGSAAALHDQDMVYAQYREAGALLWRGYTLDQAIDQCFSNRNDTAHGREMSVHYGSKEFSYQFISSPLATQMPQASGYAYGLKQAGSDNCVMVYFGDGAAQEGEAHAAMCFATTLKCPVIFFCRNNGFALSTPVEENYAGDGIVSRALGYGMEGYRVDGNDVLAVFTVTKLAREKVMKENMPVLIEAMTYRLHPIEYKMDSYHNVEEILQWRKHYFPRDRLRGYLEARGLWDENKEHDLLHQVNSNIKISMYRARGELKPHPNYMFSDVYDHMPPRLRWQQQQMWEVVNKYREHYPLKSYET